MKKIDLSKVRGGQSHPGKDKAKEKLKTKCPKCGQTPQGFGVCCN